MSLRKRLLFITGLLTLLFLALETEARNDSQWKPAQERHEKFLPCDDAHTQKVRVATGRLTILSFPITPKQILPGENNFDFKQIKNDLAIKSLKFRAKTNIFVYLAERRCAFDLTTVPSGGDDIIFIRDAKDKQMEVQFR